MRLRLLLVPSLALLPLLGLQGSASGQSPCAPGGPGASGYPPSQCGLQLGRSGVRPNESLTVNGGGCRPNSTVSLEFRSAPISLGTAQADQNGNFSTTVTIPADAAPGTHQVVATCVNAGNQQRELTSQVQVLGEVLTRADLLPLTGGASSIPTAVAGAALLGVGTLVVLTARRRRSFDAG